LLDVIIHIFVSTLVRQLSKSDLFVCELLIQIIKIKSRRVNLFEGGRKDGSLERGHWCFECWWDQSNMLMDNIHLLVEFDCFWDEGDVEIEEIWGEKFREVFW
jgi:hypothetical protein